MVAVGDEFTCIYQDLHFNQNIRYRIRKFGKEIQFGCYGNNLYGQIDDRVEINPNNSSTNEKNNFRFNLLGKNEDGFDYINNEF